MTVIEFVVKFSKLSQFSPTIVFTDDTCKRKFILGLMVDLANQIDSGSYELISYANLIQ